MRWFRSGVIGSLIHAEGVAILLLAGLHVVLDADPLLSELAEASILLVFALACFSVGHRVRAGSVPTRDVFRIVSVGLAAGIVVGLLATLFVVVRRLTAEPTPEAWFVLSIGWSLGASSGTLVGYYVTRVEQERAEQELLSKRLTILQRVLRHNIRNEVTVLRGLGENLAESTSEPGTRESLETVNRHVDRVYRLSEKSQLLSELWKDGGTEVLDLAGVVRRELAEFRRSNPEVSVSADVPERAPVRTNPHLPTAVSEALDNAARHNAGERLDLSVSVTSEVDADGLRTVEIVDDGSSIPEEELRVLSRSHELPLQHVTGLGLWVIYWVVDASDGEVTFRNLEPSGVSVRMRLPAA